MTNERHTHRLTGCAPIPLAHYLKALGILRLIAEQADSTAQGWWSGDVFHLRTTHDRDSLRDFFLSNYRPTPIVAPWNGGSGFFPKDNQTAITAISDSGAERTAPYRETIAACRSALSRLDLKEKPDGDAKGVLLIACRAGLPDEAVVSLDAGYVLTDDGPKYPPLLGTGFNDGRLEFTNNFMQRLLDLIEPGTGRPTASAASWWADALFSQVQNDLQKDSILGQFDPGAVERPVNPWDYVLMLEGALVFAGAAVKRHEAAAKGALSYPFCVRSAGIGYGSAASTDEDSSRAELWLPLWSQPCAGSELETLFSEGRVQVQGRTAKNGVDFARAISTLGTDRGIDQFVRFGFHARNGLAYFAVPLGRFKVEPQPQVNLLAEIDAWLDSFRRAASSDNAPSRAQRALRRLESAILDLCQQKGPARLQAVLIALGEAEAVLAVSAKWRVEAFQRPVPLLSPKWLTDCDDGSCAFRLAASLAGMYSATVGDLRQHVEPVEVHGRWPTWAENSSGLCNVVWNEGDLESNLIAVLQRRSIESVRHGNRASDGTLVFPGESSCYAALEDVASFLRHETDDERIAALVRGLVLLDWGRIRQEATRNLLQRSPQELMPDAMFSLLKLCQTPHPIRDIFVPLDATIARLATAGRLDDATKLAARRLIGSSLPPSIRVAARSGPSSRRIAAGLLFPLSWFDTQKLADSVLKPKLQTV